MPLAENTVSRSPSNFGLSGLRRTLVLVLGAALLLGVVHRKYWAYSTPQTNLPPHNDSPSRATIHSLMGDEVSDESAYVSETSGTDDNLNVCRRPAARSENRAAVTPAAGPIPFFGRNDEASRREMVSHLDHLLEGYKQDLVRVVQGVDAIVNGLEEGTIKDARGDRDMPEEGVRRLAAKLRRKLNKTPARWQVNVDVLTWLLRPVPFIAGLPAPAPASLRAAPNNAKAAESTFPSVVAENAMGNANGYASASNCRIFNPMAVSASLGARSRASFPRRSTNSALGESGASGFEDSSANVSGAMGRKENANVGGARGEGLSFGSASSEWGERYSSPSMARNHGGIPGVWRMEERRAAPVMRDQGLGSRRLGDSDKRSSDERRERTYKRTGFHAYDEIYQIFTHILRDWTADGDTVRKAVYTPLLKALDLYVGWQDAQQTINAAAGAAANSASEDRSGGVDSGAGSSSPGGASMWDQPQQAPRRLKTRRHANILVPGAGLGRLAAEVAARDYASVHANELSPTMLASCYWLMEALRDNNLEIAFDEKDASSSSTQSSSSCSSSPSPVPSSFDGGVGVHPPQGGDRRSSSPPPVVDVVHGDEEPGHDKTEADRSADRVVDSSVWGCLEDYDQSSDARPSGIRQCTRKRWRYAHGKDADNAGGRCDNCGGGAERIFGTGNEGKSSWNSGFHSSGGERADFTARGGLGGIGGSSLKRGFVEFFPYLNDVPHNEMDGEARFRPVLFPDPGGRDVLARAAGRLSFQAGEFSATYGLAGGPFEGAFDAIVTSFFVDTAPNVVEYVATIRRTLRPGGVWINCGPLHWHAKSVLALSLDEMLALIAGSGFRFEAVERLPPCGYRVADSARSLRVDEFKPIFWVAVLEGSSARGEQ